MEHLFVNKEDGLMAIIMKGNEDRAYRCVFKDTDADATISVLLSNDLDRLIDTAQKFINS
jgi:hypothetical protein